MPIKKVMGYVLWEMNRLIHHILQISHNPFGYSQFIIVVVVLFGIALGVYLATKPTVFQPKAADLFSDFSKYGSNPISELPQYPKPTTGGIQTMVFWPFGYEGNDPNNKTKLYNQFDYFSKEMDYIFFEQCSLTLPTGGESYDGHYLYGEISYLRNLPRKPKIGLHAGGIATLAPCYAPFYKLSDRDFLHKLDGSLIITPAELNAAHRMLYITSPQARDDFNSYFNDAITKNPAIDSYMLDGYISWAPYIRNWIAPDSSCKEGDCLNDSFWIPNLVQFAKEIRNNINQYGKEFVYNGFSSLNADDPFDTTRGGFAAYHDAALVEHPHEMYYAGQKVYDDYLSGMKKITDQGKKVLFWVQLQLLNADPTHLRCKAQDGQASSNCNPDNSCIQYWLDSCSDYFSQIGRPNDINFERFFLATYLLIQQNPLTYFGYYPGGPYEPGQPFFYKDWNMPVGEPQDIYRGALGDSQGKTIVYYRHFTNGIAVVNISDQPQTFRFPDNTSYQDWDDKNPIITSQANLPPKSGHFFLKLQNMTSPPSPTLIPTSTPSTTPTPISSPTPTSTPQSPTKTGDITGNGIVDVFDLSVLLSNYGLKNTDPNFNPKADLRKDEVINVFDLSILLSNFGK